MNTYKIKLSKSSKVDRGYTQVSIEDADLDELNWAKHNYGYAIRWTKGNKIEHMHRVILERKLGRKLETGEHCDHIDGDPRNNTRENLRVVSQAQNNQNKRRRYNNLSGHTGVSWYKPSKKWAARAKRNGKGIHLGYFETKEEAIAARQAWVAENWTHYEGRDNA